MPLYPIEKNQKRKKVYIYHFPIIDTLETILDPYNKTQRKYFVKFQLIMARNENVKVVAKNVISQLKEGKRPNVKEAMLAAGYALSTAGASQGKITKNPVYIKTVQKFEDRLDEVIDIGLDIIKKKKGKATFRDGVSAVTDLSKLKRLVTGQSTENVAASISSVLDTLENTNNTTNQDKSQE